MNRDKKGPCPICNIAQKDQHSNREAGICDALKLRLGGVKDPKGYTATPRYKKGERKAA